MPKEQEAAEKHVRVLMVQSKRIELSPGSFTDYRMGELYIVPENVAAQWIAEGAAVDPDAPEEGGGN